MAEGDDKLAKEQLRRYADLRAKRDAVFQDDWQTISKYALPNSSDINQTKTEGISDWTQNIFDTTMIGAAQVLAAGLFNWWTPPNQPWAEYAVPKQLKAKDGDGNATQWLGAASDSAMDEFARSNFYSVKATGDLGLAVFATDLIIFDESDSGNEIFNFIGVKINTYVIEEDYTGLVDTVRRELEWTYRKIEQFFNKPDDNIPKKMAESAKGSKGLAKTFKILHCIFPREDSDRLPGRKDGPNKPIASVYIAIEFQETMRVGGYEENPILCRRFQKWGTGAVWGYGPSYQALPEARQVNYVQQYLDTVAELHANPRVLVPDDLDGDVDLRAGGVTVFNGQAGADSKPSEWASVSDYKLGLEMQEARRQSIQDAYFVSVFKMLNSQPLLDKKMTAFEISQRLAEALQNMTAVDVRTVWEFVNPLMRRAFGIMYRKQRLGQYPAALTKEVGTKKGLAVPDVVSTSRMSDALKALKNRGLEETMQFVAGIPGAEQKPELLDFLNMDKGLPDYAANAGVAPDVIRPMTGKGSITEIRAARAKMMQQQRALQAAEQLGKAGKGLGGSPQWMQDQAQEALTPKQGNAA